MKRKNYGGEIIPFPFSTIKNFIPRYNLSQPKVTIFTTLKSKSAHQSDNSLQFQSVKIDFTGRS